MGQLDGKICAITGAAGGIGASAARAFAREGATIALIGRNKATLDQLALEIGDRAVAFPCDVTDEPQVEAVFGMIAERFSRLDVLYTCAAVQMVGQDGPIHELDLAVWQQTHTINLQGVFLTCKHAARLMISGGGGGSIINCGSPTGLTMCGSGYSAYGSSKAGVMALTRIMAADLAKHHIRVNGIIPGTIETPLTATFLADPDVRAGRVARHPIGRIGVPEDLDGVTVFLASDTSSFATGAHFAVDGGLTVR